MMEIGVFILNWIDAELRLKGIEMTMYLKKDKKRGISDKEKKFVWLFNQNQRLKQMLCAGLSLCFKLIFVRLTDIEKLPLAEI